MVDLLFRSDYIPDCITPGDLIYLGRFCENISHPDKALRIYDRIQASHPDAPELELALYRASCIYHRIGSNPRATESLKLQLSKFPNGPHCLEAEDLLRTTTTDPNAQAA